MQATTTSQYSAKSILIEYLGQKKLEIYTNPPPPPPPLQIKDGKMTRFGFCTALSSIWGDGACLLIYSPGGKYSPWWPIREGPARKGYLFQALGIWRGRDFTSWSLQEGKEICHLGLCHSFIKRSIFVIDSYLQDNAFTAVKMNGKF